MAKSKQKLSALQLRRSGCSIKQIANKLGVSVGSVSTWCSDITLTEDQIRKLQMRVTDPYYGKKREYLEKKKKELQGKINTLKEQGIKEIGNLSQRETFLIGVALYWGEGFKKDRQVGFATSDFNMAKFFLHWLRTCFLIEKTDLIFRVTINVSYKNEVKIIERYWSDNLNVPIANFSKPFFQNFIWKKEFENKHEYHGVIRIKVRKSVDFLRKIYGNIEGISINIPVY